MKKGILFVLPVLLFCLLLNSLRAQRSVLSVHLDPSYQVMHAPTISAAFIDQVLSSYSSPATGLGSVLYADGVQSGIDPVYALAFFLQESRMGTTGWGALTHSLGNIRCTVGYQCQGGYRSYPSWQASFSDWYTLIRVQYVATWHLTTIPRIIPVYAPSSDHNDVQGYIGAIERAVSTWRSGTIEVS